MRAGFHPSEKRDLPVFLQATNLQKYHWRPVALRNYMARAHWVEK